jgi:nucleoside-diphosphate-sugar epimerase
MQGFGGSLMTKQDSPRLFCFGLGYSAERLARMLLADDWAVAGTCQSEARKAELQAMGVDAHLFDANRPLDDAGAVLSGITHLLSSVPPGNDGDPVLQCHEGDIRRAGGLKWAGYLSSTGVYGDCAGAKVDETSPVNPSSDRSRRRAEAEARWLALAHDHGVPVHIFRLAGIYGPGRSALDQVWAGRARRIEKPGHVFSRTHVDDIVRVLGASMEKPNPGGIYNVADDEPASAADVTQFACELLDVEPPPPVPFTDAAKEMSEIGLSFWRDNRLINNSRIKDELGVKLLYPNYREGLRAVKVEKG